MSVNKRNFDDFVMTLHTERREWTTGRCLHPGRVFLALRPRVRVSSILRQGGGFLRALAGKGKTSSWAYDKGGTSAWSYGKGEVSARSYGTGEASA